MALQGPDARWPRKAAAPAAIFATAALVVLSAWQSRYLMRDSFWIDLVWADQFGEQLRAGTLYPRWLPQSHAGLGSPVFYFYPPLAFYLTAAFSGVLDTYTAVILAFGAGLLASGFAMHRWIKESGGNALLGSLLYMAAPYHLLDFLKRGALAEFCAFAWIPLLALGFRRAARSGRWGLLMISYAGLIMTHLPAALIASVFLLAPLCLVEARRSARSIRPLAAGLATGLALAAVYLIPMLGLGQAASLLTMTAHPLFQVESWSVYAPARWPADVMPAMLVLAALYAFAGAVLAWRWKSPWAGYALVIVALGIGVVPGIWSLPLLENVQFPWRIFMLAEFALATAVARTVAARPWLGVALAPLLLVSASIARPVAGEAKASVDALLRSHPDVVEYLPPESPQRAGLQSRWALDLAARSPAGAVFGFPAWEVRCAGRTVASARAVESGLLTGQAPGCSKAIVLTGWEKAGWLISSLATLMLLLRTFAAMRRQSPRVIPTARRAAEGRPLRDLC